MSHHPRVQVTLAVSLVLLATLNATSHARQYQSYVRSNNILDDCPEGSLTSFELITGYLMTSPSETANMVPNVLELSDCIDRCHRNTSCRALNFETGLCVLLTVPADSRAGKLTKSQYPVFTIFAQKICINDQQNKCTKGWAFERVMGYELKNHEKKRLEVSTRLQCMQACLDEQEFECRSANFESTTGVCSLSDLDRGSIVPTHDIKMRTYGPSTGSTVEYIENNCIDEPKKLCDFRQNKGRILKTVDFVYQNVDTVEECRKLCLSSPYRCHSFDLGDPASPNKVCRTSHLDKYSLAHIEEAYLWVNNSTTYELHSCYNVTIECKSREMVAKVQTSKIFDGKIYSKTKPNLCVNDVKNSLEFEISMRYHDVDCDVKESSPGHFSTDIVIQHHDMIVTTKDLGLSINCKYDLSNRSITNNVNLAVNGSDVDATDSQSAVVSSPNVTMRILDRNGSSVGYAQVGDQLTIRFEIAEVYSPFEIFVRELVAVDGQDLSEILLIDSAGCPTDVAIMGGMRKVNVGGRKAIEGPFDAFKFPTSDTVQFRALVTPCLPTCEPIECNVRGYDGSVRELNSFGRRRRRRDTSNDIKDEEILVARAIQIKDKFAFRGKDKRTEEALQDELSSVTATHTCPNWTVQIVGGTCLLLAQILLLFAFFCCCRVNRSVKSLSTSPMDFVDRKIFRQTLRPSHMGLPNYDIYSTTQSGRPYP